MYSCSPLLWKVEMISRPFVIESCLLVMSIHQEKFIEGHSSILRENQAGPSDFRGKFLGKLVCNSPFCSHINGDYALGKAGMGFDPVSFFSCFFFKYVSKSKQIYTCVYNFQYIVISFRNTFLLEWFSTFKVYLTVFLFGILTTFC